MPRTARKLHHNALLTTTIVAASLVAPAPALAQVPDLLNALDTGGRAMGVGGASRVTDAGTQSALDNPAGLAFVTSPTSSLILRNLPSSNVVASGNFADRDTQTRANSGRFGLSHVGYATPFRGGTLGVSYTVGGFINNLTTGDNLRSGATTIRNLREETRAQTDFFTISYGRQNRGTNFGLGLVVANQYTKFDQRYLIFDGGNQQVGQNDVRVADNSLGLGLVLGVQANADETGGLVWGASLRTPIDLSGNADTRAVYDRIPGKLSLGAAGRLDQQFRNDDFLVWAANVDYFFGGQEDKIISRRNTLGFGLGLEYSYHQGSTRFPVRLGYSFVPAGGDGFSDRHAITFGLGFRPANQPFSFDLSLARPQRGTKLDLALGFNYRPQ